MRVTRRAFCAVAAASAAACPFQASGSGEVESGPLTLASLIPFERAAARRLGSVCVDALGLPAANALVREQQRRVSRAERSGPAAMIRADYRADRTVDIHGLKLSRLEAAMLICSDLDRRARSGFA